MNTTFWDAFQQLTLTGQILFFVALAVAFAFEFINGFHDTANAVTTVIYTGTLRPTPAVLFSGMMNFLGVLLGGTAVAFSIVNLLPVDLLIEGSSTRAIVMVLSLLLAGVIWNLGTWWIGLPVSSSHTLIGSILGVGVANSLLTRGNLSGVNWNKASDVGLALLVSPLVGFMAAALLLQIMKQVFRNPNLYHPPGEGDNPPHWIRGVLLATCGGVSFAHGSNDGQKGMGLIVLILVGLLPGTYALNLSADRAEITALIQDSTQLATSFRSQAVGDPMPQVEATQTLSQYLKPMSETSPRTFAALATACDTISAQLQPLQTLADLHPTNRARLRTDLYLVSKSIHRLDSQGHRQGASPIHDIERRFATHADALTQFIPKWVTVAVALSLGLGTMIGYRRIVRTVGEKIGKDHLTYAQGASAEAVAMAAILTGDHLALPISTTHVLSSGIAGTMAANASGLQTATVRNILLAWVLTLPVCVFLGTVLFAAILNLGVLVFGG